MLYMIYTWGLWLEWVNGEMDCTIFVTFPRLVHWISMRSLLLIRGINVLTIHHLKSWGHFLFWLNLVAFLAKLVIYVIKQNKLEINSLVVTAKRHSVLKLYIVIYGGSIILCPLVVLLIFLFWLMIILERCGCIFYLTKPRFIRCLVYFFPWLSDNLMLRLKWCEVIMAQSSIVCEIISSTMASCFKLLVLIHLNRME